MSCQDTALEFRLCQQLLYEKHRLPNNKALVSSFEHKPHKAKLGKKIGIQWLFKMFFGFVWFLFCVPVDILQVAEQLAGLPKTPQRW